ncbi:MAG: putative bifunctional diguanylate cyclase/phosphodiesterase [Sciscionella sp.]
MIDHDVAGATQWGRFVRWRRQDIPLSGGYLAFCLIVVVLAAIAALSVVLVVPVRYHGALAWQGPLLLVGFVLTERFTLELDLRRVDLSISFSEIPLVIGLLIAPFPVVVGAAVVAVLASVTHRKDRAHLPYNLGIVGIEIAAAFLVAFALGPFTAELSAWGPVLLGALTAPLISTIGGMAAVLVFGGEVAAWEAVRLSVRTMVLGLLNVAIGLVGFGVARFAPAGGLLVCIIAFALSCLYLAYSGVLREQRALESLSETSRSLAAAGRGAATGQPDIDERDEPDLAGWTSMAEQIRAQLHVGRVLLHLRLTSGPELFTVCAGRALPASMHCSDATRTQDPLLELPGHDAHYVRVGRGGPLIDAALLRRSAREAIAVPLRTGEVLLGVLEAHDRLGRWRRLGRGHMRLLHTVAGQLATIVDNRRLLSKLQYDAYHDPLTGLFNRPGFLRVASVSLRERPDSVVLRVDIDVLSTVSDALGYEWADRLLVKAGERLRSALGPDVPIARLEGGLFAALLVGCSAERAHALALRSCRSLSESYPVERLEVEAAAMIGYASAESDFDAESDVDVLLQRADVALRTAKPGSNAVRGYSASMGQVFLRRFQLITQFRQAVERGELVVFYQPKLALASKQVVGVEALVRWHHPEFGDLDPDEFVPGVEATGLVDVLTSFVTDQALAKIRRWLADGVRIAVSVNLSVRNLSDDRFPDLVAEALRRHQVPPELLTFELTESGVMADREQALPVLRRLHALGLVLSVDDFGTGYSSLAYLRQLPVDEVKIDKSFVLGMGTDLGDLAVVRSIVELGHSLGLTVVAEGVEDDASREALGCLGCDMAQGYLISRPLPEDRFDAWLAARTVRTSLPGAADALTFMH